VFDKSVPLSVCCNEAASGQKAREQRVLRDWAMTSGERKEMSGFQGFS
jgi:hypothetical protein